MEECPLALKFEILPLSTQATPSTTSRDGTPRHCWIEQNHLHADCFLARLAWSLSQYRRYVTEMAAEASFFTVLSLFSPDNDPGDGWRLLTLNYLTSVATVRSKYWLCRQSLWSMHRLRRYCLQRWEIVCCRSKKHYWMLVFAEITHLHRLLLF